MRASAVGAAAPAMIGPQHASKGVPEPQGQIVIPLLIEAPARSGNTEKWMKRSGTVVAFRTGLRRKPNGIRPEIDTRPMHCGKKRPDRECP